MSRPGVSLRTLTMSLDKLHPRLLGLMIVLLLACPGQAWAQVKVVVTFSILGDLVKNIAGDHGDVAVLVGPDADPHTYEPTPQDAVKLTRADIIFANGLHFEHWLDDLYQSSGTQAKRVMLGEIALSSQRLGEDVDPHVWHDVVHVMTMIQAIADELSKVDKTNELYYQQQAEHYLKQLQELHGWIQHMVNTIAPQRRKLVTSHDTFAYFAKQYGFEIVGAAIESATTEAADPSAKQMVELLNKIKLTGVPVLFTENIKNPKLIEMLAREAGVRVAPRLYTDALGISGSPGQTYIQMMQYNVTSITTGLSE